MKFEELKITMVRAIIIRSAMKVKSALATTDHDLNFQAHLINSFQRHSDTTHGGIVSTVVMADEKSSPAIGREKMCV